MSSITVSALNEALQDLVDWKTFGIQLPGLNEHDIDEIAKVYSVAGVDTACKYHLCHIWLLKYPQGTWDDVIEALKINKEYALAEKIIGLTRAKRSTDLNQTDDKKFVNFEDIDAKTAEKPAFPLETLNDVIELKLPQAQPRKGTKLQKDLQVFCQQVEIIIHTVNSNEKWAVLKYMEPPQVSPGKPLTNRAIDLHEPNWIVLGMFGGYKCAMIQSEMGVDCHREVEIALEEFPQAQVVLAIGVAYACNPVKVKYGDVLVSKVIDGVGNIKHTADGLIISRASSTRLHHVSQKLKNVFARGEETWNTRGGFKCTMEGRQSRVHSGVLISDRTLIDNREIRDKMASNTPEAIGGEMEGVALVGIQRRLAEGNKSTPPRELGVIVIKGVADYADGQKEKKWQFTAAMAATDYAHHKLTLTDGNLFGKTTRNHYSGIKLCCYCFFLLLPILIGIFCYPNIPRRIITAVATVEPLLRQCDMHNNPPANLTILYNPVYGREKNLSHLERTILSDSVRVLGINGPPGFGKSTLAIQLGWMMVKNCFKVGYIDMEEREEIFSYVVEIFNEKRLAEWAPPMELTHDTDANVKTIIDRRVFDEWFVGGRPAILIFDNCNRILNNQNQKNVFLKFISALIQENNKGKIILTFDRKMNLATWNIGYIPFTVGNLSDEASVKMLQFYSPEINVSQAQNIAIAVENCPMALRVIGGLINASIENPAKLIVMLNNRKEALKVLNDTSDDSKTFVALMNLVFTYLKLQEKVSAMFLSFFPKSFALQTAAQILIQSSTNSKCNDSVGSSQDAAIVMKSLFIRSLLEYSYDNQVERYRMHRLIKIYFMDRGDQFDSAMEADFNSSFRIYFTTLRLRQKPLDEIREKLISELLSDHDRHNFYYLNEILLSNFKSHLYSEDELVYLAFAFYRGLINYDYEDFKTLLRLFTSPGIHVTTLPKSWEWSKQNMEQISDDFGNFFVNVLCKITSRDVCVNIYLDLLYKVYMSERCSDTFEDTLENTCEMVDCDYSKKYFEILDRLEAFEKCLGASFCRDLLTIRYTCAIFKYLKTPAQYSLISFVALVGFCLIVVIVSCCRIRKWPMFVIKQFGFLILLYVTFVGFTYTRFLRKYIGVYLDAPVEVQVRNAIAISAMILHISVVLIFLLMKFILFLY